MFKDEELFTFTKMHNFSPADGFAEINENLADMIKFVANEPSMGLFYVQQHTQKAVPNLINLKNNLVEKSHATALRAEDLDDSITTIGSMKECGVPIADEMIKEIKKSLLIMSTKKPKRGLLYTSSSGFLGRATSWSPAKWGSSNKVYSESDVEKSSGYLSGVLKSVKQQAGNFKWAQVEPTEERESKGESLSFDLGPAYPSEVNSLSSSMVEAEAEADAKVLPLSSENSIELQEELELGKSSSHQKFLSLYENYDELKADKEAKFQEWLGRSGNEEDYAATIVNSEHQDERDEEERYK